MIRLLKVSDKVKVKLVAALFRCSSLRIKVYCLLHMRSDILPTKRAQKYSVSLKMHSGVC